MKGRSDSRKWPNIVRHARYRNTKCPNDKLHTIDMQTSSEKI